MRSLVLFTVLVGVCIAAKPNLIVILGDDMGWYNIGYNNPSNVVTPFMNKLVAEEGIMFNRSYTFFYCSPTRSSMLSGRLPLHVSENNAYACTVEGAIPRNMTLLPQKLKTAGYSTQHTGKWHLGQSSTRQVAASRGFDQSFGYMGGAEDHYKCTNGGCNGVNGVDLLDNLTPAYGRNNTGFMAYKYTTHSVNFIRTTPADTPLFLYHAAQCAHSPNEPDKYANLYSSEKYTEAYINYNGMISAVDDTVRNITTALKETGRWDNTLLVFFSDNGGPAAKSVSGSAGNNGPLRGGKHTAFEGGHRVISWASGGLVPKTQWGTARDDYIHIADLYSTFCNLAGVDPTDDAPGMPPIDSVDMWPYISGANNTSPRSGEPIVLASKYSDKAKGAPKNATAGSAAMIMGDYKIVRFVQQYCFWQGTIYPNASTTHEHEPTCDCGSDGCLFNIREDPGEHNDLAKVMPEKLKELREIAEQMDATAIEAIKPEGWRGEFNRTAGLEARNAHHGFWYPYSDD